jgi:UDP-N-acetylglucosamine--N-acetylmuramyl-(pentapeptide) pyrophosphoryl-undecaprenol N-acetylglucosamine transferase
VAGFGGYVSVPVGRAATQLGIPLLLHEQNSAAGWANRYLAKQAQAVALTYAAAEEALSANPSAEVRVTGNPVRKALLEASAHEVRSRARSAFRKELGIANDDRVLLVFGGSQGARHINQAMTAMREELMAVSGLHVLHITGKNELDSVRSQLSGFEAAQGRWHLLGYCDRMPEAYSASDVAVARAGAGSLAELAAMSLPALLVPYPFATDDHQRANASAMVEAGAAVMVADADLDTPLFAETLMSLLCDVQGQLRMQRATRKQAQGDAAAAVADMLLAIARD